MGQSDRHNLTAKLDIALTKKINEDCRKNQQAFPFKKIFESFFNGN
jgi:hypothetical protein